MTHTQSQVGLRTEFPVSRVAVKDYIASAACASRLLVFKAELYVNFSHNKLTAQWIVVILFNSLRSEML
jgi:hypothetical protein